MTRVCAWCNKQLAPICPYCLSENVTISEARLASCGDCDYIFPTGDRGITSGICDPCRDKFFRESRGNISLGGAAS